MHSLQHRRAGDPEFAATAALPIPTGPASRRLHPSQLQLATHESQVHQCTTVCYMPSTRPSMPPGSQYLSSIGQVMQPQR